MTSQYDSRSSNHESAATSWYHEINLCFEDGSEETFFIERTPTGSHVPSHSEDEPAAWTRLPFHRCPCCPLPGDDAFCPAAESLEDTLARFKSRRGNEIVKTTAVDGAKRQTVVEGQLQDVGSIFVQLAVFYSGCPVGRKFKPMLNDLRTFATNQELSRHFIGAFLLKHRGRMAPSKKEIINRMEPVLSVFHHLAKRLSDRSAGDVIANSFLQLEAFAMTLTEQIDDVFDEFADDFDWASRSAVMRGIENLRHYMVDQDMPTSTTKSGFFGRIKSMCKRFFGRTK